MNIFKMLERTHNLLPAGPNELERDICLIYKESDLDFELQLNLTTKSNVYTASTNIHVTDVRGLIGENDVFHIDMLLMNLTRRLQIALEQAGEINTSSANTE